MVREQLILHTDFVVPKEHPLLDELLALRNTISEELAIPTSEEPIHVYLYESTADYAAQAEKYFPHSTPRRAFFVESNTRLNVYAQWGNSAAEDLRHELTHGYVHATLRNLPLWLDEGIAEYFEVPREQTGRHEAHISLLKQQTQANVWSPDLARLEAIGSPAAMSQQDYAEAWLWTHWLLATTPARREFLQKYIAKLRRDGTASPLSIPLREIDALPNKSVSEFLEKLAAHGSS